jgi:hypothetical protein
MEFVAFSALIGGFFSGLERGLLPRRGYTTQPGVSTPGTFRPRCRALKGRRRTQSIPPIVPPQNRDEALVDVRVETDAGYIVFLTVLGQSMWRPFRARCGLGRFPGLKPRAESCSPFGAKNRSIANSFLGSARNFVTPSKEAGPSGRMAGASRIPSLCPLPVVSKARRFVY